MNKLFRSRQRTTPADIVRHLHETLAKLDKDCPAPPGGAPGTTNVVTGGSNGAPPAPLPSVPYRQKALEEDVSRTLVHIKALLQGDELPGIAEGGEPQLEMVAQLAQEMYTHDTLSVLIAQSWRLEFEARKDVGQIFSALLRRQIGSRLPTVEYITRQPKIIFLALRGYSHPDTAINTGVILREMIAHESIAKILLYSENFYTFPEYIEKASFGVSCDAFSSFKDLLTRHKVMVANFLQGDYDRFFAMYTGLLTSSNYVTKRQSLKLLGEILLDKTNFTVMTRYIGNEQNLKLMMNLLKDRSKNIQFEAFHVFKVFVANPRKTTAVEHILRRNRDRLVAFLSDFHNDRDDEQFADEKEYVIQIIQQIPAHSPSLHAPADAAAPHMPARAG